MYSVSPSPFKQQLEWKFHDIVEMFKKVFVAPKLKDRWISATTMVRIMKAHPSWSGPLTAKVLNRCLRNDKALDIGFGVAEGVSNGKGIYRKHRQCSGGIREYVYYAAPDKNVHMGTALSRSEEQQIDFQMAHNTRRTMRSKLEPGRDDQSTPPISRRMRSSSNKRDEPKYTHFKKDEVFF